jgi:hypothetical protein
MRADPTSRFTGAVPANYARHLVPFLFEPFAADLARRAPAAAARVLELACGTGVVSAESATSVATGFLQGTPLAHVLAERKADVAAAVKAVAKRIAAVGGERPFQVQLQALVITAR